MRIQLSKHAGFCDGVKRAYDIVEEIVKKPETKKPIVVLGSLVHNEDVVKRIEDLGVKKIDFDGDFDEVRNKIDESIGTLVITAHGVGPEVSEFAHKKGIDVIDTTCPKVIKVQRLAQVFLARGYQVVIIGEKKHKEVQGIFKWAKEKAFVVENLDDVSKLKLNENEKVMIVSQTTQIRDWVDELADAVCKKYPGAQMHNTVCETTKNRQGEIVDIAKNNEVILVIGSPESSNSNRLFEIAKSENPNTHFVERASDIKDGWLKGKSSVGVTAGASSPDWIIDEVMDYLNDFQ